MVGGRMEKGRKGERVGAETGWAGDGSKNLGLSEKKEQRLSDGDVEGSDLDTEHD